MARIRRGSPTSLREPTLAIRKPVRALAAGLAAALLAAPAGVQAKSGCELVEAMLAKRDARLRGIGVAVGAKGLLDITFHGKPSALRGASNCDFDSPQDGFDLACDWDYAAGEDKAAERDLATMVGRLNACLPSPLKAAVPVTYTEAQIRELGAKHGPSFEEYLRTNRKLGQLDASYPVDENWDVTLNVSLSLDRDDRNGSLEISVSFSRY